MNIRLYWRSQLPRPKKLSDEAVFDTVLEVVAERGAEAVTVALVAQRSGLSGATLVQRFGTKQAMVHAAMLYAWDRLDRKTADTMARAERSPQGAVALLYALSGQYGDIERYADNLRVLREDMRDAALRDRGRAWIGVLSDAIDGCFAGVADAPADIGRLMVAQWQGALLLWAFAPDAPVDEFVRAHLEKFVATVVE